MNNYQRIKTGIIIPPELFYKNPCCLYCGKFGEGKVCLKCQQQEIKKCQHCEIILRDEAVVRYYYSAVNKKGFNLEMKRYALEEFMEFVPVLYPKHSDTLCEQCLGWEDRVSNKCWHCKNKITKIKNSESILTLQSNYKYNGNLCKKCQIEMGVENVETAVRNA